MIDKKMIEILRNPIYSGFLSHSDLKNITGLSSKKIDSELQLINHYLSADTKFDKGDGIDLEILDREKMIEDDNQSRIISEEDRLKIIYLMLFSEDEVSSIYCFEDALQISRNTALSDIKKLKKQLKSDDIEVKYSRSKGYSLLGEELAIRKIALYFIFKLYQHINHRVLLLNILLPNKDIDDLKVKIVNQARDDKVSIMIGQVSEIACFIHLLIRRQQHYNFQLQVPMSGDLKVNQQMSDFFEKALADISLDSNSFEYLSYLMAGIAQKSYLSSENQIHQLFNEFILKFESISANQISHEHDLLDRLYDHFVPMVYREKFFKFLENPIIERYADKELELTLLIKESLSGLKRQLNKDISNTELCLIVATMESSLINKRQSFNRVPKALVICPNGTSSSIILKEDLKLIFPTIQFLRTTSVTDFYQSTFANYDMIFSTVPIESTKNVYIVPPILSLKERDYLKQKVEKDFSLPVLFFPEEEELKSILESKYRLDEEDFKEIIADLYKIMTTNRTKGERPMLSELITKDTIQFCDKKLNWEEAIQLSAQPILNNGSITKDYINAMIDKVKEFGAFINLGPNFALPHARPEDGVKETGMSLLKLSQPVYLLEDVKHPVTMFICLASVDNEQHLKALSTLTKILSDSEQFSQLMTADSSEEIIKIIKQGEM